MLPSPLPDWSAVTSEISADVVLPPGLCTSGSLWANVSPSEVCTRAALRALLYSPLAICCTRKMPRTATTTTETTRVVAITRNCSDRCQRRASRPASEPPCLRATRSAGARRRATPRTAGPGQAADPVRSAVTGAAPPCLGVRQAGPAL